MDERFAHRDKAGASFNSIGAKGKSSRKCARIGDAVPPATIGMPTPSTASGTPRNDAASELPGDEALAAALAARKRVAASTVSSAEPYRAVIERWVGAGVQGRAIHAALHACAACACGSRGGAAARASRSSSTALAQPAPNSSTAAEK